MATDRPPLRALTPLLLVRDLPRAVAFYQRLGFRDPAVHGEPPCFAMLHRDGLDLMLQVAADRVARPNGDAGCWDLALRVADLAAEQAALAAQGIDLAKGPTDTFYGMREVEVVDPDGHRICIGQDLPAAAADDGARQVWHGALQVGGRTLRLTLKLAPTDGGFVARLDSPDQNAWNLPVDRVAIDAEGLRFAMGDLGAEYVGRFEASRTRLAGTWTQRGHALPLCFDRAAEGS